MHKLIVLTAITLPLLACELVIEPGDDVDPDSELDPEGDGPLQPRDIFNQEVLPLLNTRCSACHAGSFAFINWMAPDPTEYDAVTRWPGMVNRDNPADSRILNKGAHEGPAWSTDEFETILLWLILEARQ